MADLDKTIKSLQYHLKAEGCCSCISDAVELLKEYKQHLQLDLETLEEQKRQLEFELEVKVTLQPHPCKECNKYGCDVNCPHYGK